MFFLGYYRYLITKDDLQIILSAQGSADVQLQKGLFKKEEKARLEISVIPCA